MKDEEELNKITRQEKIAYYEKLLNLKKEAEAQLREARAKEAKKLREEAEKKRKESPEKKDL